MTARPGAPPVAVHLAGAVGGQGTTTVATVIAALAARHRPTTLAARRPSDVCALAGLPPGRPHDRHRPMVVLPGLTLQAMDPAPPSPIARATTATPVDHAGVAHFDGSAADAAPPAMPAHPSADLIVSVAAASVIDCGRADEAPPSPDEHSAVRWLVVRGPCYLALRAALETGWPADGVVLLAEPGRALRADDVSDVLGLPVVAEVPVDPQVARAVDAGVLLDRLTRIRALRSLATLARRHWPLDLATSA